MRKLLAHLIICFAFISISNAQEAVPFKTEKAFYIYGDAVAIGNNILSRDSKVPFNQPEITNDDIPMVYVDVDEDDSTFSSSTSNLQLPDNQSNIVYAALYWTGTYSYIEGSRREQNGQFFFQGKREKNRSLLSNIKFKLPGQNYQTIQGKVIFDGYKKSGFHLNSPYACYADVTTLLQKAEVKNGNITVANVYATKGYVAGGSSAGWMLYVVYEAPTTQPKYITTFNGFAHVGTEPVVINLKDFKSPEQGNIVTNLTLATLEGDSDITEDECIIANPTLKTAIRLSTNDRDEKNFFNSSIDGNIKRFPESKNTLGFDIARLTVPNNKETVIDNNTDNVELLFNTKEDRFYLFFAAFETEISKTFFKAIETNLPENTVFIKSENLDSETSEETLVIEEKKLNNIEKKVTTKAATEVKLAQIDNTLQVEKVALKQPEKIKEKPLETPINTEIATSKIQQEQIKEGNVIISSSTYVEALKIKEKPLETQQFKLILEKNAAEIEGAKKGYYVITKFFSSPENAFNWQKDLKTKGYNSNFLIDESNKLYYVYIFHTENFYDAYMQHKTLLQEDLFKDNWVFKVNMTDF